MNDNVPAGDSASDPEADADALEVAARVLKRRFGRLLAGDLISGLTRAAASIRAGGGAARQNQHLERQPGEPWDIR